MANVMLKASVSFTPPDGGEPITLQCATGKWDGRISTVGDALKQAAEQQVLKLFPELDGLRQDRDKLKAELDATKQKLEQATKSATKPKAG